MSQVRKRALEASLKNLLLSDISNLKKLAVILKYKIRKIAGSPAKWYGLENSNMMIEYVPLFIQAKQYDPFKRKTQ